MNFNLNAFGSHPDSAENRGCIKDADFLGQIDALLGGNPTEEQLEEVRKTLVGTNKAWMPKWLFDDLVNVPAGPEPEPQQHDYVEIGGIKWATMNIGASTIYDTGLYFQWGDTQGYTASQVGEESGQKYFSEEDYKWYDGTQKPTFTKYNYIDNKTTLDLEDDAVHAAWGGNWRMPTIDEIESFVESVNSEWTNNYNNSGTAGWICEDKEDNTKVLFFPASGEASSGSVYGNETDGHGWILSSNICDGSDAYNVHKLGGYYDEGEVYNGITTRFYGFPCRGVYDDQLS